MGLLGDVKDTIGGAVDFVGDALGGGGIGAALGGALGSVVPGLGTALGAKIGGGLGSAFGGNGGGGGGELFSGMGQGGFVQPDPVDFGPFTMNPQNLGPMTGTNGGNGSANTAEKQMAMKMGSNGTFQSALMAQLVKKSVNSSAGRAVLEAVTSGSLEGGIIQSTQTVSTPRGSENHSPPGFRTVYIDGQPFAIFKPVAKALGVLPKTSKAKLTAADMKAITKADRLAKTIKRLGMKTGRLKITNK